MLYFDDQNLESLFPKEEFKKMVVTRYHDRLLSEAMVKKDLVLEYGIHGCFSSLGYSRNMFRHNFNLACTSI
jgi:hypothetical protein